MIESGGQTNIILIGGSVAVQHSFSESICAVECSFSDLLNKIKWKKIIKVYISHLAARNVCLAVPNITKCGTAVFHNLFYFFIEKKSNGRVINVAVD